MSDRTEALRMLLIAQAGSSDRHTSDKLQHKIDDLIDAINKDKSNDK